MEPLLIFYNINQHLEHTTFKKMTHCKLIYAFKAVLGSFVSMHMCFLHSPNWHLRSLYDFILCCFTISLFQRPASSCFCENLGKCKTRKYTQMWHGRLRVSRFLKSTTYLDLIYTRRSEILLNKYRMKLTLNILSVQNFVACLKQCKIFKIDYFYIFCAISGSIIDN